MPAHLDSASPGKLVRLPARGVLFSLFFLSGFCGLLYQVVWTRLAFAKFGIITPVMSIVISAFMLGLALGSWFGGRIIGQLSAATGRSAALFYGLAEAGIGLSAFAVPRLFEIGEQWLRQAGESNSNTYLWQSAGVIALALLPWCVCMGTTFPFMMAYVRERSPAASAASFSFLYLANVIGAMMGTVLTAVALIECLGFRRTLMVGAIANFAVAAWAFWLAGRSTAIPNSQQSASVGEPGGPAPKHSRWLAAFLFTTGFVSMAMEVVWMRAFTPYLKTQVYSFALVLFVYLLATCLGSALYRRDLQRDSRWSIGTVAGWLIAAALLPVVLNDPRWLGATSGMKVIPWGALKVLASICPFCFLLGYLSPQLIDVYAGGHPRGAGRAYALNVVGCILGPLLASYLLLPNLGVRVSLVLLAVPLVVFGLKTLPEMARSHRLWAAGLAAALFLTSLSISRSVEENVQQLDAHAQIRRDHAATTISVGTGMERLLLVNGVGMTLLTPVTKCMAHLSLGFHRDAADSVLVICFGMGTSFRSALSWDVETTAVELVPGVVDAFEFYHEDAQTWRRHPKAHIVVDDGRRFLNRSTNQYDIILLDPPPPVEAAGSSLLYSKEFYALAQRRLKPGGILQAWYPDAPSVTREAVARALQESFAHVKALYPVDGGGVHFLASAEPFPELTVDEWLARLPAKAKQDLLEWNPEKDLRQWCESIFTNRVDFTSLVAANPRVCVTDDQPFNEYYLLRKTGLLPVRPSSPSAK